MTQLDVRVRRLDSVEPHFNADRLNVARIGGFVMVVAREGEKPLKAGDLVVYIPEGAVVPLGILGEMGLTMTDADGRVKGGAPGRRARA